MLGFDFLEEVTVKTFGYEEGSQREPDFCESGFASNQAYHFTRPVIQVTKITPPKKIRYQPKAEKSCLAT